MSGTPGGTGGGTLATAHRIAPEQSAPKPGTAVRRRRLAGLGVLALLLVVAALASLAVGTRALSPAQVWHGLFAEPQSDQQLNEIRLIVQTVRVPRTVLAIVVGLALGVAGALIQGFTRNPIADTGLLGVNAGASFAVVMAIAVFGVTDPSQYVWFAFLGAALAGVVVFGLASLGRGAGNPLTLALAGQGVTVFLAAMTTAVSLSDQKSLNALRFWNAGSVAGVEFDVIGPVAAFIGVGLVAAVATLPSVNLLNLGDDVARALGVNVARSRTIGILAVTLLAGAATAACGPIAFLGLMVAHVARYLTGPDYRWLVPYAGLLGAVVLLVCDIMGRVVARPGELDAGIVVALFGAPFFVALVWRGKLRTGSGATKTQGSASVAASAKHAGQVGARTKAESVAATTNPAESVAATTNTAEPVAATTNPAGSVATTTNTAEPVTATTNPADSESATTNCAESVAAQTSAEPVAATTNPAGSVAATTQSAESTTATTQAAKSPSAETQETA